VFIENGQCGIESRGFAILLSADYKEVALSAPTGTLHAGVARAGGCRMQHFSKNLFCAIVGTWRMGLAVVFRSVVRAAIPVGVIFVSVLASMASAQIAPNFPNPTAAPNPLTKTLSIFTSNMQDKIMNAANMMPESKYSYRPTKEVRSFGEILTHIGDISFFLCSTAKGEAPPPPASGKTSKADIIAYVKASFSYCDGAYSGFTDAHLNDPANFFGNATNKMFLLTQVGNHDALHYGNLVTYLRINGQVPSGGWF
jgi:uncharacterized damage-inducible protein DinB